MWFQGCDFAPSGANYTTYCLPWRAAIHHRSTHILVTILLKKRLTDYHSLKRTGDFKHLTELVSCVELQNVFDSNISNQSTDFFYLVKIMREMLLTLAPLKIIHILTLYI